MQTKVFDFYFKREWNGLTYDEWKELSETEQANHFNRAVDRAKALLKEGDKVIAIGCGGMIRRFQFVRFKGVYVVGKSIDDVVCSSIVKINGQWVNFMAEKPERVKYPYMIYNSKPLMTAPPMSKLCK